MHVTHCLHFNGYKTCKAPVHIVPYYALILYYTLVHCIGFVLVGFKINK